MVVSDLDCTAGELVRAGAAASASAPEVEVAVEEDRRNPYERHGVVPAAGLAAVWTRRRGLRRDAPSILLGKWVAAEREQQPGGPTSKLGIDERAELKRLRRRR